MEHLFFHHASHLVGHCHRAHLRVNPHAHFPVNPHANSRAHRLVTLRVEAHHAGAAVAHLLDGGGADAAGRAGDDHALAHAATATRSGAFSSA